MRQGFEHPSTAGGCWGSTNRQKSKAGTPPPFFTGIEKEGGRLLGKGMAPTREASMLWGDVRTLQANPKAQGSASLTPNHTQQEGMGSLKACEEQVCSPPRRSLG